MQLARDLWKCGERILDIDHSDLAKFNPRLEAELINNPEKIIDALLEAFTQLLREVCNEDPNELKILEEAIPELRVRIHAPELLKTFSECRAKYVEKFVTIEGLMLRASPPKIQCVTAVWECKDCGHQFEILQYATALIRPDKCMNPGCKNKTKFILVERDCEYMDLQYITISERQEEISDTRQPHEIRVIVLDELVDRAVVGDIVRVSGVFHASFEETHNIKSNIAHLFLVANSLEIRNNEEKAVNLTPADIAIWAQRALDREFFNNIMKSIAPNLMGLDVYKLALLLACIGGQSAFDPKSKKRYRGDIHIGFLGDASTGKSSLLTFGFNLMPRSIKVSGKGTSGVGLTAAIIRDSITNEYICVAGAIPRANGSICFIDELDKMEENDRKVLHEAMEDQTISIAKAGIVATFICQSGIVFGANPASGRWEDHLPVLKNINLPPTIFSRLDLLFIFKDKPDMGKDRAITKRIHQMKEAIKAGKTPDLPEENKPTYSLVELRQYVAIARSLKVEIPEDVYNRLNDFYLKMRSQREGAIGLDPRQFEGLIRLCEARTRSRLATVATLSDAQDIIDLKTKSLMDCGYDALTGEIDIDRLLTGKTKSQRELENALFEMVRGMQEEARNNPVFFEDIFDQAAIDGKLNIVKKEGLEDLLKELSRNQRLGIIKEKDATGKEIKMAKIFNLTAYTPKHEISVYIPPSPKEHHDGKYFYEEIESAMITEAKARQLQEKKYQNSPNGYDFLNFKVIPLPNGHFMATWESYDHCD